MSRLIYVREYPRMYLELASRFIFLQCVFPPAYFSSAPGPGTHFKPASRAHREQILHAYLILIKRPVTAPSMDVIRVCWRVCVCVCVCVRVCVCLIVLVESCHTVTTIHSDIEVTWDESNLPWGGLFVHFFGVYQLQDQETTTSSCEIMLDWLHTGWINIIKAKPPPHIHIV